MKIKNNISWFSIIEVMIAIFIFAMTMASIFMVISSSINLNNLNKNSLIASNLAREWIEIVRNIRDTNYKTYHKYNWLANAENEFGIDNFFKIWSYYKIENNYQDNKYNFKIDEIIDFAEWKSEINWKMQNYKLYLDTENRYTYESYWNNNTIFYRYIYFDNLIDDNWNIIDNAMKLKSKVIWYSKWYHDFEIETIITDFNRL